MWKKRNGTSIIALISTMRGFSEHMRSVVWQPFVLSLGVPMSSLGSLESTYDLIRNLVQPIFGSSSDLLGRKRFLILRELLFIISMLLFIFTNTWVYLLFGVALLSLSYAVEPVWWTFIAEKSSKSNLASAYSIMYASYMGAGLIAPAIAGILASSLGYSSVYALAAFFGVTTLIITAIMLAETNNRETREAIAMKKIVRSLKEMVKPYREMRGFYLSMALDGIAFGIGSRILYGMLTKSHGYDPCMISFLATSMTVSWALVQIPLGKVVDRIGYKTSLIISQIISCIYLLTLLLTQSFGVVLVFQAIFAVAAALWVPAEQAWIVSNIESGKRGAYVGNYLAFKGLFAFPAPFIGGVLFDCYGFFAPLFVNLIGAVIDVLLISILVKN